MRYRNRNRRCFLSLKVILGKLLLCLRHPFASHICPSCASWCLVLITTMLQSIWACLLLSKLSVIQNYLHSSFGESLILEKKSNSIVLICPNEYTGFPGGSDGKESACNARAYGLIPGLGRSLGEGNGYPLQYFCQENSMDRRTRWATVHGITNSQTRLSNSERKRE